MNAKVFFLISSIICIAFGGELQADLVLRVKKHGKEQQRTLPRSEHADIQRKYQEVGLRFDESGRSHQKELFTTSFLKDAHKVVSFVTAPPAHAAHCEVDCLEVVCDESHKADVYFFDRQSTTLLVAAPGFGFSKEIMTSFVEMFPTYDIILFDQRGHGLHVMPETKADQVVKAVFDVVPSRITWGKKESKDVYKIVQQIRQDRHTKTVGLGFCYSSLIFAQAQKKYPDLFTHLIFDGTIVSLAKTFKRIKEEPGLIGQIFPGIGRCSFMPGFGTLMKKGVDHLVSMAQESSLYNDVSFSALKVPVLLWYGKSDLLVPLEDFELLWKKLSVPYKAAIMTENRHLINHLKEKEVYRWSVEQFLAQKLS